MSDEIGKQEKTYLKVSYICYNFMQYFNSMAIKKTDLISVFFYNGRLKEVLLELSIKEFLNEIKDIDFNLINYQIDQFYV